MQVILNLQICYVHCRLSQFGFLIKVTWGLSRMKVLDPGGYFCSILLTSHGIHSTYLLLENIYFISEGEVRRKFIDNKWMRNSMAEFWKQPFVNSCQSSVWHAEVLQVWVRWCKCSWGCPRVFIVFTLPDLPATVWLFTHLLKNFSSCMTSKAICVAVVLNLQFSHMFSVWLERKKLQNDWHLAQGASDLLCVLSANRNWGNEVFGSVFSCCSLHCLITNLWMSSQPLFHHFGEGESGRTVSGCSTREGGVWPICLSRFAKV